MLVVVLASAAAAAAVMLSQTHESLPFQLWTTSLPENNTLKRTYSPMLPLLKHLEGSKPIGDYNQGISV